MCVAQVWGNWSYQGPGFGPAPGTARWGWQLPGHSGVVGSPYGLDMGGQLASTKQYKVVHAHARAYWGSALAPWTGRYVYTCLYAYTFVHVAYQLAACGQV